MRESAFTLTQTIKNGDIELGEARKRALRRYVMTRVIARGYIKGER